jgi:hypothetical protein
MEIARFRFKITLFQMNHYIHMHVPGIRQQFDVQFFRKRLHIFSLFAAAEPELS